MGIAVNDNIRVTYFGRLFEQRILTVLNLRCSVAPTGTDTFAQLTDLAAALSDVTMSPLLNWIPLVSNDFSFDEVRVQRVLPTRTVYAKHAIGVTGSAATACTTANVAVSVEKRSNKPGRHGIGRVQMAGVPAAKYANGLLDATYLGQVQAQWHELVFAILPGGTMGSYRWCIAGSAALDPENDIIDTQAEDTVRVMRRRTLRVGI